jgi:hypothetical protein
MNFNEELRELMKISLVTTGTRRSHRLDKVPKVIPHTHPQPLQNTANPLC